MKSGLEVGESELRDVFISNWFIETWRDVKALEGKAWYINCLAPTA